MTWEQLIQLYISVIVGSMLGTAITIRFLMASYFKRIGNDIGNGFTQSIDKHYADKEKDITRKQV